MTKALKITPLCLGVSLTVSVSKNGDNYDIIHTAGGYVGIQPIPKSLYDELIKWQKAVDEELASED